MPDIEEENIDTDWDLIAGFHWNRKEHQRKERIQQNNLVR
jgi:hypothetical protein